MIDINLNTLKYKFALLQYTLGILACLNLNFCSTQLKAQNLKTINGIVLDKNSKEPVVFATIYLKIATIGAITDDSGRFSILVPESLIVDTLEVNSAAYQTFHAIVNLEENFLTIAMEASNMELSEVVVRPMPPTFYIQRAMNYVKEIRPQQAFQAEGYYLEKILENQKLLKYDEGIFKSYIPKINDTIKRQYQLALYRSTEKIYDMQFMKKERVELEEKENKKSKGKNLTGIDYIFTSGGPAVMIHYASINRRADEYLDSLKFKYYNYSFSNAYPHDGDLMVINFESKGVVNHAKVKGEIFIHLPSNAILKISGSGNFVIPLLLRPLMFLYGFSAHELYFEGTKEYQIIHGKWYFKNAVIKGKISVTKKRWFNPNEHADFEGTQLYSILKLWEHNATMIDPKKRFDREKPMRGQANPDPNIKWEFYNLNNIVK